MINEDLDEENMAQSHIEHIDPDERYKYRLAMEKELESLKVQKQCKNDLTCT